MVSIFSFSQENYLRTYEQEGTQIGFLVRGKVIAGQLFEDLLHMNLSVGTEMRFLNYHSIGVDFVYFRNRQEEESYDTITKEYFDNRWSDYDRRHYVLFDYRFYLNFWPKRGSTILPYLNIFTKQGVQTMWFQYRSVFKRNVPYYLKSHYQEYGAALGVHFGFPDVPGYSGKWGIDLNLGAIRNFTLLSYENEDLKGSDAGSFSSISQMWKPHMRLNLYGNIFKKLKKKSTTKL